MPTANCGTGPGATHWDGCDCLMARVVALEAIAAAARKARFDVLILGDADLGDLFAALNSYDGRYTGGLVNKPSDLNNPDGYSALLSSETMASLERGLADASAGRVVERCGCPCCKGTHECCEYGPCLGCTAPAPVYLGGRLVQT